MKYDFDFMKFEVNSGLLIENGDEFYYVNTKLWKYCI